MAKNKTPTQEDLEKQLKKELEKVPEIVVPEETKEKKVKVIKKKTKEKKGKKDEDKEKKEEVKDEPMSLDLSEFTIGDTSSITKYTTDIMNKVEEIKGTMSVDELNKLIDYNVNGGERPSFADAILTQSTSKIEETLKISVILQLLRLPELFDRQMTLQKSILSPDILNSLTYADMAEMEKNISKEINDMLETSLKIITQLNKENRVPTSAERLANLIMGLSPAARQRVQEVVEDFIDESK